MGAFIAYKPADCLGYLPNTIANQDKLLASSRQVELAQLDKDYADSTVSVLQVIAAYGAGKTSLIQAWLQQLATDRWPKMDAIYGWMFATSNNVMGSEAMFAEFVQHMAAWLGVEMQPNAELTHKVEALVLAIQQQRLLLILDNLPQDFLWQNAESEGFQQFIYALSQYNPGLCICLSAQPLQLELSYTLTLKTLMLPNLAPNLAVQLLTNKGVKGSSEELTKTAQQFGNQAYALTLLGNYLREFWQGNTDRLDAIPIWLDMHDDGRYTRRLLAALENALAKTPEIALIYLLCACEIPVPIEALVKLLQQRLRFTLPFMANRLPPLLAPLRNIKLARLQQLEQRLRSLDLLSPFTAAGYLQVPMAVRDYFQQKIESRNPDIWQALEALAQACQTMQPKAVADSSITINLSPKTISHAKSLPHSEQPQAAVAVKAPDKIVETSAEVNPTGIKTPSQTNEPITPSAPVEENHAATKAIAFGYHAKPVVPKALSRFSHPSATAHLDDFTPDEIEKALDDSLAHLGTLLKDKAATDLPKTINDTAVTSILDQSLAELEALLDDEQAQTSTLEVNSHIVQTVISPPIAAVKKAPMDSPLKSSATDSPAMQVPAVMPLTVELKTNAIDELMSFNPLIMASLNYERAVLPNLQATLLTTLDTEKQLDQAVLVKNWPKASQLALKLYEQQLNVGNLPTATHRLRQSVAYAHLSGDKGLLDKQLSLLHALLARTGEKPPNALIKPPEPKMVKRSSQKVNAVQVA